MESPPGDLCGPDPGDFALKLGPAQGRCEAIWVPLPTSRSIRDPLTHLASATAQSENPPQASSSFGGAERLHESFPAAAHDRQPSLEPKANLAIP